ncbi:DUF5916 domain-containing protein [Solilutibacter silvestris]|uniref:DUF5916 domain-containing protein n=1 Tax=Solilutibacter silvestris TaxID=1645665 RepID=A0A2K1Q306_9GAMM|nr:DUF5916 domain-containing protein [Lysobacter silvestris]PNS09414.1 hypothetical protein Lysil_1043 [Lysobacter silvestris]
MKIRTLVTALSLACVAAPALAADIKIDGKMEPGEWDGARHISDFHTVQPFTGQPGSVPTEVWYMATPKGLAVAFRNHQPAGVERRRQKTRRDEDAQTDRVNVMLDFDGDGRQGYDFTVMLGGGIEDGTITKDGNFNNDWDGNWLHAVSEDDEGWTAEILIPWSVATMGKAKGDKRTIGVYFDRVVGVSGERMGWPAITFERPQFLAKFQQVEVPAYSQALLALTPYVSAGYNMVDRKMSKNGGMDVFWKPNGQFQLSGTINPDFGQVESDDLVVNFTAQESFFSDKRPFFTENQSIFDFGMLMDNSQLIYTRRVGGPSDDGKGAADIDAAVKLNGSFGKTNYGLMWAEERGDAGRSFRAARVTQAFDTNTLGAMATQVVHPFLDRTATVFGVDDQWKPNDHFTVVANAAQSAIDEQGQTQRKLGASVFAQYEMKNNWHQQWAYIHYDKGFEINDFGYLGRADLDYAQWEVGKRFTDLPKDSMYVAHDWRWRIDGMTNANGLVLQREFRVQRNSKLRDGGNQSFMAQFHTVAHDDLLLWGHAPTRITPGYYVNFDHEPGRRGNWQWMARVENAYGMGVASDRKPMVSLKLGTTYFFSDALNAQASIFGLRDGEWLLWQHDNLLGQYEQRQLMLAATLNWNISPKQELRVKLQAIGLTGHARQAWRVQPDMTPVQSNDVINDFNLHTLGFQIRYRYELAPLSNLYVVYGRGGYDQGELFTDARSEFQHAFQLRNTEMLMVKLAYRFEL